jgi:glutathione S-transferase
MILYALPVSTYSAKVRMALEIKEIAYEMKPPPGGYSTPEYMEIIPLGTIPGIEDGNLKISESDIITEYLEEKYPDPPLLHGDSAARAGQRFLSRYHDLWLEPNLRALFAQMDPATRDVKETEYRLDKYQARLDKLETLINPNPYLASEYISMADIAFPATLTLADILLPVFGREQNLGHKMQDWHKTVYDHPVVKAITDESRQATLDWMQSGGG